MLIKPEILDETIINCLWQEYGLRITQLDFLPLGGDLGTAVYRAAAAEGISYFCKLRRGDFSEISVEIPKLLSEQGIHQIIPPLVTQNGCLWAVLDSYKLVLYPFIEGTSGFEVELSAGQWESFGRALKQIHTTNLPEKLKCKIEKESYSSEWRERCRNFIKRLGEEKFDDPIAKGLAAFLLPRRETVLEDLDRAERLAHALASSSPECVLCHADIHPGNLFIDTRGSLFIVDWDYPMLSPKESDLMFIGGGQGFVGVTAQEEEMYFYRNYGPSAIDPMAMAYYRYERNIVDISVECARVLSDTLGDQERAHSFEIITWGFLPDSTIERAFKSDRT